MHRIRLAAVSILPPLRSALAWSATRAPELVAAAGLALAFAGVWDWLGRGVALTALGVVLFGSVAATWVRGGYAVEKGGE